MADTTESLTFKIVVLLVSAAVVGITIPNIIYFNNIRTGTCNAVSSGTATTMLWLNIALLVVGALIFLWSLWRLFFTRETRQKAKHYIMSPTMGAQAGFTYVPSGPVTAVATSPSLSANILAPQTQTIIAGLQAYE